LSEEASENLEIVRRRLAMSAEARTSVVRKRSGWTSDASRDDWGRRSELGRAHRHKLS
jgi:hypothetical protein